MSILRLANNLVIPIGRAMAERGGQRIAIIGKSGSGKTNTQLVTTKAWMDNGWPAIIIDPMNGYRTLKQAGLPLLIAGARSSADLHLTVANAGRLAEVVFQERISVILELSMYEEGQDIEVLEAFLRPFWRQFLNRDEDAPRLPFGIIIDEAHLFAPQSGKTDVTHLINDMGKRGRQLGLSMIFSTQRPASIQKEFLLMSNMLIAHKVTFGDVGVVAEAVSQPPSRVSPIIKKFKTGQALVMADADLLDTGEEDFLVTSIYKWEVNTNALLLATQESSRVRPLDVALVEQLRETMQRPARASEADKDALIHQLRQQIRAMEIEIERLAQAKVSSAQIALSRAEPLPQPALAIETSNGQSPHPVAVERTPAAARTVSVANGQPLINGGARRILQKLADIHPMLVTRKQIATLTGYTESGGTFSGNWGMLKRFGFVQETDKEVVITQLGFDYLGIEPRTIPNTTADILAMWHEVLRPREWEILTTLVNVYPHPMRREQLAEELGMTGSGGAFNSYLGNLKRNGLIQTDTLTAWANGELLLL